MLRDHQSRMRFAHDHHGWRHESDGYQTRDSRLRALPGYDRIEPYRAQILTKAGELVGSTSASIDNANGKFNITAVKAITRLFPSEQPHSAHTRRVLTRRSRRHDRSLFAKRGGKTAVNTRIEGCVDEVRLDRAKTRRGGSQCALNQDGRL
jgi:hypothetical protein